MSESGKPKGVSDLGGASPAFGPAGTFGASNGSADPQMFNQLISLFADTVHQAIWITDADGALQFLNKYWFECTGVDKLPETAAELASGTFHPNDAAEFLTAFRLSIEKGEGFEVEQRIRDLNGEYRWFLNRANPYRDPETGQIVLWFGVGVDIHDRKIVELELKESEQRLRLVQSAAGIASFDYDIRSDVATCSDALYALCGLPAATRVDRSTCEELIHPEDRSAVVETIATAVHEGKPFDHEFRIVRKDDGNVRWISGRGTAVLDGNSQPYRVVGGIVDVSDERAVQAEETFLFEVSEAIRTATVAEQLLGTVASLLGSFLHLHRCLFNEIDLDSDTETVHFDYSRDGGSVAGKHKISVYSSEASALMAEGRSIVNHDSQNDPRTAAYFETTYLPAKELAYITVPMLRDGRWVASLWCSDDRARNWTTREVALVESIAERSWAAVERLRTEADLRKQRNRLRSLADTARSLAQAEDLEEQLRIVTDEARQILGAHQAITTFKTGDDWSRALSSASLSDKYAAYREYKTELNGSGIYRIVCDTNRPLRLTQVELEGHPQWKNFGGEKDKHPPMRGWIAVPLIGENGSNIGVIQLTDKIKGEFTAEDEAVLVQLAQLASGVIGRTLAREAANRNQRTVVDLVENAPFGMYVVDSDFRIATMNAGSQKTTFANVRPIIGRDFSEAIRIMWPEPVAADIISKFRHTLETGEPYFSREFTHLRGDIATVESYEWELQRVLLPDGKFGVVCYFYDSTKLREAERREREQVRRTLTATAKFEAIFNQSALFAAILDPTGNLIEVNDLAANQCGYSREELIDKPFWETPWWGPSIEIRSEIRNAIQTALNGEMFRSELPYFWADGSEHVLDIAVHPIRDEKGNVIYVNPIGIDVTDRRRFEEELKRVSQMPEQNPNPVMRISVDGEVIYSNSPAGELLELWRSEGKRIDDQLIANVVDSYRVDRRSQMEVKSGDRTFTLYLAPINGAGYVNVYGADITERKESEELYRALTELSPQIVYMSRPDGVMTYVNQYALEWTGKSQEDLLGGEWTALIHPDHRERIFNVWKTAMAVVSEYEVDVPFRHVDGTYRTLYNRALPIKDDKGEVLYWIGTALDVEDRKRAEENLRESEQRFRQASDSAPVLIWMADESKHFIWFNKPWLDFTGRSLDEESGKGWMDGIHPEDVERFENIFTNSFNGRNPFVLEYRTRRFDGAYRWVMNQGVPRETPDGRFVGYIGSCIDINDRKEVESALRRSEARLQLATRIGNYGTWDLDLIEDRQVWSDKLFEIFGLSLTPDRVVPRDLYERCIYHEDLDELYALNEEALRTRGPFSAEYRIRRADTGDARWLSVVAEYFYDFQGRPTRSVGITQDITDRKLASEAMRASEERLKLAQEAGKVGIWDWDAATQTTFWSQQMWELYGESPSDTGPGERLWFERMHPDDRRRMTSAVSAALSSSSSELKEEFRIIRNDGEIRWLEAIATIERDQSDRATRMYGVNLDITERKAVAERIRSSEAQLRLITDSIPALVSYIDRDERYRFINQRYSEWFGASREQMIGHTMSEVIGEAARDLLVPKIADVLKGSSVSFEAWVDYKAAGRKFVHVSYVPDLGSDGNVPGFYALVTDLTTQKLSEELLRSSEDRMRTISESFTDYAIVSMDDGGRIESWNLGAQNIFGYSAEEIIGKPIAVLFTREDVERGVPEQELHQAASSGRASDERWHVRKDGTRFFASGVTAPLYNWDKISGFAKIATDLTEKKRSAEALQRAYDEMENRVLERTRELASMNETLMREISERQTAERQKIELLKRLVSGQEEERRRIARDLHDHLGQRLTAMRLKLASLREACSGDEDLYARATRLQQIAELIDSEVSFLAWELRPTTLDELGLIDAMGAFVKEWSRHYEIDAEFHSSGLGDARLNREAETHLYRITQEALNNIYKHASATKVSVLIERAGMEVVLIIEDNGVGFADPGSSKTRAGNSGLGLGGMKERADLVGGSLEIESEIGKGTTIYVRIPVAFN